MICVELALRARSNLDVLVLLLASLRVRRPGVTRPPGELDVYVLLSDLTIPVVLKEVDDLDMEIIELLRVAMLDFPGKCEAGREELSLSVAAVPEAALRSRDVLPLLPLLHNFPSGESGEFSERERGRDLGGVSSLSEECPAWPTPLLSSPAVKSFSVSFPPRLPAAVLAGIDPGRGGKERLPPEGESLFPALDGDTTGNFDVALSRCVCGESLRAAPGDSLT